MSLPHLSLADARNLHLAAQGLLNKPRRQASLEDILHLITFLVLIVSHFYCSVVSNP